MCVPSNFTYLALFRLNAVILFLCALVLLGACSPERAGQTTNSSPLGTESVDSRRFGAGVCHSARRAIKVL